MRFLQVNRAISEVMLLQISSPSQPHKDVPYLWMSVLRFLEEHGWQMMSVVYLYNIYISFKLFQLHVQVMYTYATLIANTVADEV